MYIMSIDLVGWPGGIYKCEFTLRCDLRTISEQDTLTIRIPHTSDIRVFEVVEVDRDTAVFRCVSQPRVD